MYPSSGVVQARLIEPMDADAYGFIGLFHCFLGEPMVKDADGLTSSWTTGWTTDFSL